MKRIVAIGGGGFLDGEVRSPLDGYVLTRARTSQPRVCFIPTAGGDAHDDIDAFYAAFARYPVELSHLTFFRKPRPGAIALSQIAARLPEQDVVYVGGGNTRSMLAVWREWGLPQVLRTAYAGGTVLAGVSAGAICWFEWGASDSAAPGARSSALRCLGLLKGSCTVHWGSEMHRRRDYLAMVRAGALPPGYGLSDSAALLFEDGRLSEGVAATASAQAVRVDVSGERLRETALALRLLDAPVIDSPRR